MAVRRVALALALACWLGATSAQTIAGPPRGPLLADPSIADNAPVERLPPVGEPSGDDFESRLRFLENEIRRIEAERAAVGGMAPLTVPAAPDQDAPTVDISVELQVDSLYFGQDSVNRATVGDIQDGSDFRRARAAALGDYYQTSYRIEFDFALPGRPAFLDVWGACDDVPILGKVRIGHFFEPFCLERMTANRYFTFLERGLPDHFSPQRNTGICSYHVAENKLATWALGVFNAESNEYGDSTGDARGRAVTTRVTWLPYYDEPSGGRYYTHLGVGYSFRTVTNDVTRFRARPEARFGDAVPNVPFFVDTGFFAADSYQLYGLEFAWIRGPLSLQAEYFLVPVEDRAERDPLFDSFYCYVSYFLTGEHRPYLRSQGIFDRVHPHENFFAVREGRFVRCGSGAWEVAARVSHMDLDSENIRGGRLTDVTLGLNWYLTPYTRISTNYVHAFLDNPTFGDSNADIVGLRMQFDY